ncbi:basic 7S globulin-like [Cicer arietinum]|uniref:SBg7S n=1 Tax=Cicer arietinum TaxID=3827 RepID=A0A1S2XV08_CICAR|nr:basic 7S globulin-like [Cicer arietinum]
MASISILHFLFCFFLLVLSSESTTQTQSHSQSQQNSNSKPNLLVLPVQQDANTGLHWAYIHKRTPLMQLPVLIDLNGKHLWVNCEQHYSSSTYQAPFCHSTQCARANTHTCHTCVSSFRPGCHNNTCGLMSANPVTQQTALGELAQDVFAIYTTRGPKLGPMVTVPQFLFSCAPSFLAQKGLPNNVQGVAGLAHSPISLPNQLSSHFGLKHQFTTCLSRYPKSNGAIIFGDAANNMRFGNNRNYKNNPNILNNLIYTPLTITPEGEYRMHVTSIQINEHTVVPVSGSMLSSYPEGVIGGTLISTSIPYTTLQDSLFETFVQVFAKQFPKEAQVNAVGPFGLCFDSKRINKAVNVEFVLDRSDVVWRISGENLMVEAKSGISCLGIVNGGLKPKATISIGSRQLEENLLLFDLVESKLGFSNSLSSRGIKCSDLFDFNNNA